MDIRHLDAPLVVELDRKLTRAAARGKGVGLSAKHIDVLVELGLLDLLSEAKSAVLKEQARARQVGGTPTDPIDSRSQEVGAARDARPSNSASASRERARMLFGN